jgi:hypothetical protein
MASSVSAATAAPKSIHFLAFVHGMWGSPDHLKTVDDTIQKRFAETEGDTELVTLRIKTNANSHTYDGLDWGAERAVKEVSFGFGLARVVAKCRVRYTLR